MVQRLKELALRRGWNRKRLIKLALGTALGGVLGWGFYLTVGCSTGACPITSDPVVSTVWGALLGALWTA